MKKEDAGIGGAPEGSRTVRYRHLLSKGVFGPKHPLRVIAHCDIDAAYAQFQAVRLGLPPDAPVACSQWDVLLDYLAVNYPARALGVTKYMKAEEAKKVCPQLVCPHRGDAEPQFWDDARYATHKISLEPFRRESLKIMAIFAEVCPLIEKASIDEAFLDLSQPVRDLMLQRHPELSEVPADAVSGLDTPLPDVPPFVWPSGSHIVPEDHRIDHPHHVAGRPTWSDYALALGAELMQRCRTAVWQQLSYTCSAGLARNKSLAKLCSAYRKPNAQTVLRDAAVSDFLEPIKFSKIRFLGRQLGRTVGDIYKAETVGDLWGIQLDDFQRNIGEEKGLWLFNALRGVDYSEVVDRSQTNTMLSRKDFNPPLTIWSEISHGLHFVASDLSSRLRDARLLNPSFWPTTLILGVRRNEYRTPSRHHQAPFPYQAVVTTDYIAGQAEKLAKIFFDLSGGIGIVTNLSLSFASLDRGEKGQKTIKDFMRAPSSPIQTASTAISARSPTTSPNKRKAETPIVDLTLEDSEGEVIPSDDDEIEWLSCNKKRKPP